MQNNLFNDIFCSSGNFYLSIITLRSNLAAYRGFNFDTFTLAFNAFHLFIECIQYASCYVFEKIGFPVHLCLYYLIRLLVIDCVLKIIAFDGTDISVSMLRSTMNLFPTICSSL